MRVCLHVHCHNRLVDPHIPVAALGEANPVLVKRPLEPRSHFVHTHTHSQVQCIGTRIKWVCPVCKYVQRQHTSARQQCLQWTNCVRVFVSEISVIPGFICAIPRLIWDISFIQPLWDVNLTSTFLLVCSSGLDSTSASVSIGEFFCPAHRAN